MEAVESVYSNVTGGNITVVPGGHDRGARTMHRAAVSIDQFPKINALGVWLADIVPFVEEFASFSNPNDATGYFTRHFFQKKISQPMSLWHVLVALGPSRFSYTDRASAPLGTRCSRQGMRGIYIPISSISFP